MKIFPTFIGRRLQQRHIFSRGAASDIYLETETDRGDISVSVDRDHFHRGKAAKPFVRLQWGLRGADPRDQNVTTARDFSYALADMMVIASWLEDGLAGKFR